MKVKNLKGTAEKNCQCGAWTNHWYRFVALSKAEKDAALQTCVAWHSKSGFCKNRTQVGAHVQEAGVNSSHHIVPLCFSCNGTADEFEVPVTHLVSANVSETCGKSQAAMAKEIYGN